MRIIAGAYKGRVLKTTTGPGFRPAMGVVREAIFSILEAKGLVWPETRVLDLFAGSGSLGFEALSRGAGHVCFVDTASYAAKVIEKNAELLGVESERYSIRLSTAGKVVGQRAVNPFDLVFIDPPYKINLLGQTVKMLLQNGWIAEDGIINAEIEEKLKFDPLKVHEQLELIADRTYGQTRVLLWQIQK